MASTWLVRIPLQKRTEEDEDFALIHVQKSGAKDLDLTLTGTENSLGFTTKIREDKISELQAKSQHNDPSLWSAVLHWVLLGHQPETRHQNAINNLELQAAVEDDKRLIITFKQSISGITQRLGSLTLEQDDHCEPDLFQWAGAQASTALDTSKQMSELQARLDEQKKTVEKLHAQLEDFTQKKAEQENIMLEKFRQLMNTKKLKIRDQQRLLAGAKVDPRKANDVKTARGKAPATTGEQAHSRKRKGGANGVKEEEKSHKDPDEEVATVASETEDEPASSRRSDESDEDEAAFEASHAVRRPSTEKKTTSETQPAPEADRKIITREELPPRRQLPFQTEKKAADAQSTTAPSADATMQDGSSDDETDDEL